MTLLFIVVMTLAFYIILWLYRFFLMLEYLTVDPTNTGRVKSESLGVNSEIF